MIVEAAGETHSLKGELVGEIHRVLQSTENHPPGNQHQKDPICFWVAEEVTESQLRAKQVALFPLRPIPHIQSQNAARWLPHPGEYLRLHPLFCNRHAETKNIYICIYIYILIYIWPKLKNRSMLQKKYN